MSWASKRRATYLGGVISFFFIIIGFPLAYWYFSIPATCGDGIQNQGETAIDRGGSCPLLDERALQPHATLWTRSFRVRDGSYNAAAYIQNPNREAGVRAAYYRFGLYDTQNIIVAERYGSTFIMPGSITPIFEGDIDTGNRIVAHVYFEFTETLVWERMKNMALPVAVNNKELLNADTVPRLKATALNSAVSDVVSPSFVAVVFDPAGNAFAASATRLDRLPAGGSSPIVFTWPDPFPVQVGRIDILPLVSPTSAK
ncbi:MAG: hypothetical protein Q7S50_03400 [bacterium]|nr:hypothetical protein [bacterium]